MNVGDVIHNPELSLSNKWLIVHLARKNATLMNDYGFVMKVNKELINDFEVIKTIDLQKIFE